MRQKLLANLAAVGGLADLGDFAHKLQPDLVPADVTASEDTVEAQKEAMAQRTYQRPSRARRGNKRAAIG